MNGTDKPLYEVEMTATFYVTVEAESPEAAVDAAYDHLDHFDGVHFDAKTLRDGNVQRVDGPTVAF